MPKRKTKLTCDAKKKQLADELEGIEWYNEHGFGKQASEEFGHYKFLKKQPCSK